MQLSFGQYDIKVRRNAEYKEVWDICRRKWVALTPEEQVRQMWLHWLTTELHIASSSIAVERKLRAANKWWRFDICVLVDTKPTILIECKAPNVELSPPVWEQLMRYNAILNCNIYIITNGLSHIAYSLSNSHIEPIDDIDSLKSRLVL